MRSVLVLLFVLALSCGGCASRSPDLPSPEIQDTDPVITQLSTTARKQFDAGSVASAVSLYRRALERARAIDNSGEITGIAYNLAACLMQLGDVDGAATLLVEAEREARRSRGDAAPIILMSAQVARAQGNASAAQAALDRLEQMDIAKEMRGHAYVIRAHLACDQNNAPAAEAFMNRARGYAGKSSEPGLAGAIANANGRIAGLNKSWLEAAEAFDREADMMQRAGRPADLAVALEKAGVNYLAAERAGLAADRFYRSARSSMAQGNYLDALRVIEQAAQLKPEAAESAEIMNVIAALFEEIRQSVESQSQAGAAAGRP